MKFRILGPLEVIGTAGPVHLGARSHRILLLALLSHPNEVVSVDRLQEWLWPDSLPRSAAATLQAHMSVVRRLLEPDREPWSKPSVVITRSPGYMIRVGVDDVDNLAFESLLTRARVAHGTGEFPAVRSLLRDALALWRGDALSDVAFLEAAQPMIRRLQELRLSALQLYTEAELVLGRHDDVIPDLMQLISAHPVHEPFYGQLMLALYRSGRRAEALGVYALASEVLAREMALEPGPDLRRLRDAITSNGNATF